MFETQKSGLSLYIVCGNYYREAEVLCWWENEMVKEGNHPWISLQTGMKINDWVLGLICLCPVTPLHLYSHVFLAECSMWSSKPTMKVFLYIMPNTWMLNYWPEQIQVLDFSGLIFLHHYFHCPCGYRGIAMQMQKNDILGWSIYEFLQPHKYRHATVSEMSRWRLSE